MAAHKCSMALPFPSHGPGARDQGIQVMTLASAVAHLNTISAGVSVEPSEYTWGAPTLLQQQALYTQFLQLGFMCSMPHIQYATCPSLQPGRPPLFPGFMTPFAGFLPPIIAPSPAQSPAPTPSSPSALQVSGQQSKASAGGLYNATGKLGKAAPSSKKTPTASKAKPIKNASISICAPALPLAGPKDESDIGLEDICRLLGDDAFLEHLQDDVMSEGSNGSSTTSDGRKLSKNNSNDCLSGTLNNDGGVLDGHDFGSAFDLEMSELPAARCSTEPQNKVASLPTGPAKTNSGDLNNLIASSPARPTRSSRLAAREAAAAAAKDPLPSGSSAALAASPTSTKILLKTNKGGVHKVSGSRGSKVQPATTNAAAAAASTPHPSAAASPIDPETSTSGSEVDCTLTAADLSRLLGEDDTRIPEGWDLDLDFENPFSCSIGAF